jgi:Mrp family chromosome partitioning ATPase
MTTNEQVHNSLGEVIVPLAGRSLLDLNLVNQVEVMEGKTRIVLAAAGLAPEVQEYVNDGIRAVLSKSKIKDVTIDYVEARPADLNRVKNVIAVMSGKGGVGKSLVSSLLAIGLRRQGNEVGILDADITGSSIPRMFGIKDRPIGSETGILPVASESGIVVMSMNLLIAEEESAVIWRAPLLTRAITQFWTEVLWGNLDYLIVDLPPGTADAPLTVLQSLPVTGIVIVFTPQGLVEMIVKKAVNMAQKMDKTILGIVENMSYFYVRELDKKYELFGRSKGETLAKEIGAPLIARLPIDPELARLSDSGDIEKYQSPVIAELGAACVKSLERKATRQ